MNSAFLLLLSCVRPDSATPNDPQDTDLADTDISDTDTIDTDPSDDTAPVPSCGGGVDAIIEHRPYEDLQAALDASVAGDTIQVCPGNHPGPLRLWHPGPIILEGDIVDPASTTIDGQSAYQCLLVSAPLAHLTIRGIQFARCRAEWLRGGALEVWNAQHVAIDHSLFLENYAEFYGGAAFIVTESGSITDVRFSHNGTNPNGIGGALHLTVLHTFLIDHAEFSDNTGARSAGALLLALDDASTTPAGYAGHNVQITHTDFLRNWIYGTEGTAVHFVNGLPAEGTLPPPVVRFADTRFIDNITDPSGGPQDGDGVLFLDANGPGDRVELDRVTFSGNYSYYACSIYAWNRFSGRRPAMPLQLIVRDSTFLPCGTHPSGGPHIILLSPWVGTFVDVDFGAGPTANPYGDFIDCDEETDGVISGEVDRAAHDHCP